MCVPEFHSGRWARGNSSTHRSLAPQQQEVGNAQLCPGTGVHTRAQGSAGCPDACTQPIGAARPAQRRWQPSHLSHRRSIEVFPVTLPSGKKGGEAVHSLIPHTFRSFMRHARLLASCSDPRISTASTTSAILAHPSDQPRSHSAGVF